MPVALDRGDLETAADILVSAKLVGKDIKALIPAKFT
jgi:hypothetical protein